MLGLHMGWFAGPVLRWAYGVVEGPQEAAPEDSADAPPRDSA